MSVEAQYYLILIAGLAGLIIGVVLLYRFIKAKAPSLSVRIALWVSGLLLIGGICLVLGMTLVFLFLAHHPMDPPIK